MFFKKCDGDEKPIFYKKSSDGIKDIDYFVES